VNQIKTSLQILINAYMITTFSIKPHFSKKTGRIPELELTCRSLGTGLGNEPINGTTIRVLNLSATFVKSIAVSILKDKPFVKVFPD